MLQALNRWQNDPLVRPSQVVLVADAAAGLQAQEARNAPFCLSREKFHAVVSKGVRNISDTLQNPPIRELRMGSRRQEEMQKRNFSRKSYILRIFRLPTPGARRTRGW